MSLPKPYYQDDAVTIYHGDCREILPHLEPVDLVLTDPPYGIAWKGHPASDVSWNTIANDESGEVALWLLRQIPETTSIVMFGAINFAYGLPSHGRWICWDKRLTENADKMLGSAFELAWMNKSSGFDQMFRVLHGGVVNKNGGKRVHPTEKPITLMGQIISRLYPEATLILDPFMGSGTTLRAAKDLGRKAIGIELEEKYCEIAAKRMKQEVFSF